MESVRGEQNGAGVWAVKGDTQESSFSPTSWRPSSHNLYRREFTTPVCVWCVGGVCGCVVCEISYHPKAPFFASFSDCPCKEDLFHILNRGFQNLQ